MGISSLDRKLLWVRSGNVCAWPDCNQLLTEDHVGPSGDTVRRTGVVIGEEAHIRAQSTKGPRADPAYADVDCYANLILLCPTHHRRIDSDPSGYSVDWLVQAKNDHEARMAARMSMSDEDDAVVLRAAILDTWADLLRLDAWTGATRGLLEIFPRMSFDFESQVRDACNWIAGQEIPGATNILDYAFQNHREALFAFRDFMEITFETDDHAPQWLVVPKGHKQLGIYNEGLYAERLRKFYFDAVSCNWLAINLTKSINHLIWATRVEHDSLFRILEGYCVIDSGNGPRIGTFRPEYGEDVRFHRAPAPSATETLEFISTWYQEHDPRSSGLPPGLE